MYWYTNSKKVGSERKGKRIICTRHPVMLSGLTNSSRCELGLEHGGETERICGAKYLDVRLQCAVIGVSMASTYS